MSVLNINIKPAVDKYSTCWDTDRQVHPWKISVILTDLPQISHIGITDWVIIGLNNGLSSFQHQSLI